MAAPPNDYDSPWKEALEHYFSAFLALLAPRLHAHIDWAHAPEFLDKELQAIARDAGSGRRYADKLVRVQGIGGQPALILVHVEVQGGDTGPVALARLGQRMFQYFHRIGDRYLSDRHLSIGDWHQGTAVDTLPYSAAATAIFSLGVLTDSRGGKPFLTYRRQFLGCGVLFRFPVVHLGSWYQAWDKLERLAARNPFALVVMAQLRAQDSRDGPTRLVSKTALTRLLYNYDYPREDILQLFRLIDWIIALPPELEPAYVREVDAIEQELNMAYVTSIERLGEQRGKFEGRQEGRLEGQLEGTATVLQTLIQRKFGELPSWARERIAQADAPALRQWALNVLDADRIEAVFD